MVLTFLHIFAVLATAAAVAERVRRTRAQRESRRLHAQVSLLDEQLHDARAQSRRQATTVRELNLALACAKAEQSLAESRLQVRLELDRLALTSPGRDQTGHAADLAHTTAAHMPFAPTMPMPLPEPPSLDRLRRPAPAPHAPRGSRHAAAAH